MKKIYFFLIVIINFSLHGQNVIKVPGDFDFIQEAIDNAKEHDTILVAKGRFYENLIIEKPIVVIGDSSIIDGNFEDRVCRVEAANVYLSNLIFRRGKAYGLQLRNSTSIDVVNCSFDSTWGTNGGVNDNGGDGSGIYISSTSNIIIENCFVHDNFGGVSSYSSGGDGIGINIINSQKITISNSTIEKNVGNFGPDWYGSGIGIEIKESEDLVVENCKISNNANEFQDFSWGVLFRWSNEYSNNCLFSNNLIEDHYYGVEIMASNDAKFFNNEIHSNRIGLHIQESNPLISGSTEHFNKFYNNYQSNLDNSSGYLIDATYNYWGFSEPDSIAASIVGNVNFDNYIVTDVADDETKILHYKLYQNYPNPFNPTTNISFSLLKSEIVSLAVFNSLGEKVITLIDAEQKSAGKHSIKFNAVDLPSGLYIYKLTAGKYSAAGKMLLLK